MLKNIFSIFSHFLYLGCISFGGPAAHLGYFQRYFIEKHQWLDLPSYSRMVALSQFLPGPASSQVGFSIGYHRAGLFGAIAAFIGFTLPSFVLLFLLAVAGVHFADSTSFIGAVYGLKLLAVVIVGDAVISMAKVFCQNKTTKLIALATLIVTLLLATLTAQLLLLIAAGIIGILSFQASDNAKVSSVNSVAHSNTQGLNKVALMLFLALFVVLPLLPIQGQVLSLFNSFYQAGSLVFGGGHVVLPMLQQTLTEQVSADTFILGYASAQAVPGPMFTLATFLGANILIEAPLLGALIATSAIFLPGFLLILALQGVWQKWVYQPKVAGFVMGVNAAVVGLLAAAFYQPIAVNAIYSVLDIVWVTIGFVLLKVYRLPILAIVACFIALGLIMTQVN